ncbi:MAG: hypothetical protein Q7K29_07975 [Thermoleophilia bacterium]|nr:hypothetical protein [Thermoleophilia bacterium]
MATGRRFIRRTFIPITIASIFALLLVSCSDSQAPQASDALAPDSAAPDTATSTAAEFSSGDATNKTNANATNTTLAGTIIFFLSSQENSNSPTIVTTWAVSPNGGEPQRIVNNTGNPAKSTNFNLSPDCSRLLFHKLPSSRTSGGPMPLMIMNTDGTGQVQILGELTDISKWLPDGNSIVYGKIVREGSAAERPMAVTRTDTSGAVLGSWSIPGQVQKIAMSPDGTRIAAQRLAPGSSINIIYIMDLASGVMTELLPGMNSDMKEPTWSPDSRKLAFVASSKQTAEIWSVDLQTREPTVIWRTDPPGSDAGIPEGGLAWSPDGAALAFVLAPSSMMGNVSSMQLLVVGSDGADPRSVAEVPGWADIMTWCNCAKIPEAIAAP